MELRVLKGEFQFEGLPSLSRSLSSARSFLHLHLQGREEGLRREIEDRRRTHGQARKQGMSRRCSYPSVSETSLEATSRPLALAVGLEENLASNVEREGSVGRSGWGVVYNNTIFLMCFHCGRACFQVKQGVPWSTGGRTSETHCISASPRRRSCFWISLIRIHNLDCLR